MDQDNRRTDKQQIIDMQVSIISPVYNVAPYICECIDSILNQTTQDWEVIFVDDHGTDGSIDIAKKYISSLAEDISEKFRFIETPENSGPGISRNYGIKEARGEYIAFVDSDDKLEPQMLDRLLLKAYGGLNLMHIGTPGVDLVYCNAKSFGQSGRQKTLTNPDIELGKSEYLKHFKTYIWTYIYRRKFLLDNGLEFPSERASEDTNFLTKTLLLARTIRRVNEALYLYRVRPQSLTTIKNKTRYKERLSSVQKLMDSFESMKKNPSYEDLHLDQYDKVMRLIYYKKGVAQSWIDYLKNII